VANDNKFFVRLGWERDFYFKRSVMEDWLYELLAKKASYETHHKILIYLQADRAVRNW
jgi:hypothetical protein